MSPVSYNNNSTIYNNLFTETVAACLTDVLISDVSFISYNYSHILYRIEYRPNNEDMDSMKTLEDRTIELDNMVSSGLFNHLIKYFGRYKSIYVPITSTEIFYANDIYTASPYTIPSLSPTLLSSAAASSIVPFASTSVLSSIIPTNKPSSIPSFLQSILPSSSVVYHLPLHDVYLYITQVDKAFIY